MKIAIVNPFGNSKGHSHIYALNICDALSANNAVTLITSHDCKIKSQNFKISHYRSRKTSKIPIKNFKSASSIFLYAYYVITGTFNALNHLKFLESRENYDAIHLIGGETLTNIIYSRFFLKRLRHKLFMTVHNSDLDFKLYVKTNKIKAFYKFLCKAMFFKQTFSGIMVHGEQMKIDLCRQLPSIDENFIFPINIGIKNESDSDDYEQNLNNNSNKIKLLFFGVIRRDKGLDVLIQALDKKSDPNIKLSIIGSLGQMTKDEIHAMPKSETLKSNIFYDLRYVDETEIRSIFKCHDFLVLPYKKTFNAQSVVLTIAAKYKIPIISSDSGQNGLDVKRYNLGLTFEAENINDLIKKLEKVKSLDRAQIISNFDTYSSEHTWESMARRMVSMYKN